MFTRLFHPVVAIVLLTGLPAAAQRQPPSPIDLARERAREPYQAGLNHLKREAIDEAVRSFEEAVELDPTFDMAYYMLGRTHMTAKRYASAIVALTRCRDVHLAEASMQSINRQEIQHQRRRRIDEINERIVQLDVAVQTPGARNADQLRNEIRMLQERKRQIEDAERQLSSERAVPAFVSLSLGSAYFRAGRMPEAEATYKATVAADPKVGEAHNNLAVVYLETGRLLEAERALAAAERAGYRVHPDLKKTIKAKREQGAQGAAVLPPSTDWCA